MSEPSTFPGTVLIEATVSNFVSYSYGAFPSRLYRTAE
jgi:hypothetical protein